MHFGLHLHSMHVFAHVFAFMQRCRDLLEVCEGRLQFAPQSANGADGEAHKQPIFSGPKGSEIVKRLEDIETSFSKNLNDLRNLNYDILDVTNNGWHDDHATFNAALKHLEVMTQNVIRETCSSRSCRTSRPAWSCSSRSTCWPSGRISRCAWTW